METAGSVIIESYVVEAASSIVTSGIGGDTGGGFGNLDEEDEARVIPAQKNREESKGDFGIRFTMSGPTVPYYQQTA